MPTLAREPWRTVQVTAGFAWADWTRCVRVFAVILQGNSFLHCDVIIQNAFYLYIICRTADIWIPNRIDVFVTLCKVIGFNYEFFFLKASEGSFELDILFLKVCLWVTLHRHWFIYVYCNINSLTKIWTRDILIFTRTKKLFTLATS